MKKQIKVVIYVRVSTQEQAKEGYSIGEQIDRLTKYAEAHGWIVVKVYTDAGHSGATMKRPALQEMLEDVKAGGIDKVLVYKLDRLSRSQKDTLNIIEDYLLENNCDFESMNEKFDTSTSFGRAMVGILAVFAQLEREQIKERMSMGIEARIKEGKWRGGIVPFGYDYEPALNKLVINEYEAMIIKFVYDEFLSGTTTYSIYKKMNEKGYSFSNNLTNPKKITYVLTNKTYAGYLKLNGEWIKALHDPIVSEETFDKAQLILKDRSRRLKDTGFKANGGRYTSNLGGLIYCGRCGARYCKIYSGKNYKTNEYYHENYTCYSRSKQAKNMIKDPNCMNKIYRVNQFDEMIFNEINKLTLDPDYLKEVKSDNRKKEEIDQIKTIEHQIKQIDNQVSRFMDLYGIGKFSIEQLDEKTSPLMDQKEKLQKEIEKLQTNIKSLDEPEIKFIVQSLNDAIDHGTLEQRRSVIQQLIDKIVIDGDDITIHWNFY